MAQIGDDLLKDISDTINKGVEEEFKNHFGDVKDPELVDFIKHALYRDAPPSIIRMALKQTKNLDTAEEIVISFLEMEDIYYLNGQVDLKRFFKELVSTVDKNTTFKDVQDRREAIEAKYDGLYESVKVNKFDAIYNSVLER
jgi:hypothetical protein